MSGRIKECMNPIKRFESIKLNPIVGMMLLVVVIVWTAVSLINNGNLELTLPVSRTEAAVAMVEQVAISVQSDGSLIINNVGYSLNKAQLQLQLLSTDTPILLMTDEAVDFRHVVEVIDILKGFSLESVSILMKSNI